jgi:predicted ribosomally synthesized peptide with SipW-like signal peptide
VFEAPDIVSSVVGGVFQFFKASPTTTTSGLALVFQETNQALAASAPLLAQFDLGNSSTARKRVSVVVADGDLTDLAVCSFWLPPGAALQTYRMRTHTTANWANASVRFYAEDGGASGGNYLLDNVSLKYITTQSVLWTDCVDPTTPAVPSGAESANLLINGDFATGTLASWSASGTVTTQITAGVLELIRPTSTVPSSIVFQSTGLVSQSTGQPMVANQILTSTLQIGNTSTVRKRVTVHLHDLDVSDQTVCTFWIPPSQGLLTYTMRGFATKAWSNATLSIYPETVGTEQWIQIDNVTLRRTGASPIAGPECMEPVPGVVGGIAMPAGLTMFGAERTARPDRFGSKSADRLDLGSFARAPEASHTGTGVGWRAEASTTGRALLVWAQAIDLTAATSARLSFESWLSSSATSGSSGVVQVSVDGVTWRTVATVPRTDGWTQVDIDLGAFAGRLVYVRFVFDAVAPGAGVAPDVWRIDDVSVAIGVPAVHLSDGAPGLQTRGLVIAAVVSIVRSLSARATLN